MCFAFLTLSSFSSAHRRNRLPTLLIKVINIKQLQRKPSEISVASHESFLHLPTKCYAGWWEHFGLGNGIHPVVIQPSQHIISKPEFLTGS